MTENPEPLSEIEKIEFLIREHQAKQKFSQCYGTTVERVKSVLRFYEDKAVSAMSDVKQVRDDWLVFLRALVIVLTMTGEAQTHGEKNARLRGAIELLDGQIESMRKQDFELLFSSFHWPDMFRSDWPTRRLMERIHDQDRELADLRQEVLRSRGELTGGDSDINF